MATLIKRNKALSVSPLKTSQPLGASLAFLGLNRAMPMMHGSQGCTAFAKVMFVRHFREPIPLQTTAMEQVSTVMGADENIVEGLKTLCAKSAPACIGLVTTGLSETQGTDIHRAVKAFRLKYPEYGNTAVVPVNTPDYVGSLESGYAAAVRAMVETLVPSAGEGGTLPGRRRRQVNVLPSPSLTPGDVEALKELLEAFELRPLLLPDIADALDGHLTPNDFNPLTIGGTPVSELELMGDSIATLVIGPSLQKAADLLLEKTGVPDYRFDSLLGLDAVDAFIHTLSLLAERPVPAKIERQRAQLQDAMVDSHFMLGQVRVALAGEPDELLAMTTFLQGMGAEVVAAVTAARGPAIEKLPIAEVKVGDLEDLEQMAREAGAELLLGNSHLAATAERLGLPLQRMGFPQYDLVGGYQRVWIGYRGSRQAMFDLANLLLANHHHHEIKPYRSALAQGA
ncbi:MAG TPA: nitrogenase iron-molybdenum cofactor biosynthesis protein NifN [Gammaproteobacteria bacterium]|jgi:nitrogenase molybdenum-iron protein NifN